MVIIILVIIVIGKFPNFKFKQEQEISLYPTVGEIYQYNLALEKDTQFMCKQHPKIQNIQVINQCEEIFKTQGNQFRSISSNNTHFGTLSNDNEVIIYQWKNQMIKKVGSSTMKIDSQFYCFNINLSFWFSILIDCYYNNEFILFQLIDQQQIIAYSVQSFLPNQTKMQSILNGTNTFLVYAQYFQNYSILSLFSSQFKNLSSINKELFVDFDIPITISPNIYAITSNMIFQMAISLDSQFYYKSIQLDIQGVFTTINVYYNLWSYSQCDQIQLSYVLNQEIWAASYEGCENFLKQIKKDRILYGHSIQKILQSNQFLIYQSIDTIFINQSNSQQENFKYVQIIQQNSLLYLNSDNELFSFNQDIIVYKIAYSNLQINFTNQEQIGYNCTFQLICQNIGQYRLIYNYFNFYLQVLSQNDTNIYVMLNQDFSQYQTLFVYNTIASFNGFSGQLLNYTQNKDDDYFQCLQITFQKVFETNQSYQLVSFLSIYSQNDKNQIRYPQDQKQFLIGYGNQTLNLFSFVYVIKNNSYKYSKSISINFFENVSSLQVAYSIYPPLIIIGLGSNDTIYLFQYQYEKNLKIFESNYTFEQSFSDFLVTYNSIIILIPHKEIQILTQNYENIFTLDQQSINQLFKNIKFDPIQITMNVQLQSSFLYINNINEVIIISIDQNSFPIPITIIYVNLQIKLINLVSELLIFSYLCNNGKQFCFQVWNVQYLPKYYFVKNLHRVDFDNNIKIQSDNTFFYVTFSNYTVYVYNPHIPYHMSLYYVLELSSPIQNSEQFQFIKEGFSFLNSIIISNNTLYILRDQQIVNLTFQQQNQAFNNQISYPYFIYNYSVTSALNDTAIQQTSNQSITFYSNLTIIQNLTSMSAHITPDNIIPQSKNFTYPMNLFLDRQVGQCYLNNMYQQNKYCSLTQISSYSNSIPNIHNYSLITSINNEFFALQNNFYIQTVNSDLTNKFNFNYSDLNLSSCLQTASQNYSLYSLCSNNTSGYNLILNFTLSIQGEIINLNIIQLPQMFITITKSSIILNQIFILGILEKSSLKSQELYWLNQTNNTFQNISNGCTNFFVQQIQQKTFDDNQSQQIIIFYVHEFQVNYTLMRINNQTIQLQNSFNVQLYYCNQQSICKLIESEQYFQILIIEIQYNHAIILITTIKLSYIINIKIITSQLLSENRIEGRIMRSIPNYGSSQNGGNSFYKNGVLLQQFFTQNINNSQNIIGAYYFNNLLVENLLEPILMYGSFITTNFSYAMIVNQEYQHVTSLFFYNQSIYNYSLSTWNVSCLLYNDKINVSIVCQNNFSNGTYLVTFNLPSDFRINFGPSAYALLLIIFLLLLYFHFKFKEKTRNLEYINSEIEL
ncbi:unnamed protein product [Paramecium sonneborni]|uniref:Transmembrane protein n=1 Tax=Paramecium sonneborni TaxID=65129 RepID=A0A8S1NIE4_9CILI|nr:unnamed protein product [Paramecium sonneborni]